MDWDALGIIAEVVGAIAVVVTLGYLALETRLSRQASQAGLTYSSVELYSRWRNAILQNSDLAAAVAKSNRGEKLTDEEQFQLTAITDEIFIASCVSFASVTRAPSLHDRSLEVKYLVRLLTSNPGLLLEWERFKDMANLVSADLVRVVDRQLNEASNV